LGIFIVGHAPFRCYIDHTKRSFYRAAIGGCSFYQGWSLCFRGGIYWSWF